MKNENLETCKAIAMELEKYVEGYYYNCNDCGENVEYDDDAEIIFCPHCGSEDLEPLSLYDYFKDMLDIDWILDSNFNYKACRIMVAFGGPTIYISTYDKQVELYWWTESAKYPLSYDVLNAIDEWAEEWYVCTRGGSLK